MEPLATPFAYSVSRGALRIVTAQAAAEAPDHGMKVVHTEDELRALLEGDSLTWQHKEELAAWCRSCKNPTAYPYQILTSKGCFNIAAYIAFRATISSTPASRYTLFRTAHDWIAHVEELGTDAGHVLGATALVASEVETALKEFPTNSVTLPVLLAAGSITVRPIQELRQLHGPRDQKPG